MLTYLIGSSKRWPNEILLDLPMIDGARVREDAFEFRKRTSCAGDQIVVEMLIELTGTSGKPSRAVSSSG